VSRWPPTSISNQPDDKIPLRSAASLTNIEKTLPQFTVIDSDGEEHSSFQPLMVDAAQMRLAQNLNAPPALNHAARLDRFSLLLFAVGAKIGRSRSQILSASVSGSWRTSE